MSEVAVHAELTRATARRILATLVALRYCEADGRYFSLRPRALGLGLHMIVRRGRDHAEPAKELTSAGRE